MYVCNGCEGCDDCVVDISILICSKIITRVGVAHLYKSRQPTFKGYSNSGLLELMFYHHCKNSETTKASKNT